MNFFIDFDHTLYNTKLLTKDMLITLATYISDETNLPSEEILVELKNKFKRGKDNIYDIFELIEYFAKQYSFEAKIATNKINEVLANGQKYLFDDAIPFLKYLKENGNKIYILSYNEKKVYFQAIKISGSGILEYTDGIFPTTTMKGLVPLDFPKCIFIDDKPKDLESIYKNRPYMLIRIRRENDTYSNIEISSEIPKNKVIEDSTLTNLIPHIEKMLAQSRED